MNWKVGDRAVCITPGSRMEGVEVIIVRGLHQYYPLGVPLLPKNRETGYSVDPGFPPMASGGWAAQPQNLIPIDDDASWDEIERSTGWKPSVLETISE